MVFLAAIAGESRDLSSPLAFGLISFLNNNDYLDISRFPGRDALRNPTLGNGWQKLTKMVWEKSRFFCFSMQF